MPCLIFESSEVLHWLPQAAFPASLPIACLHLQGGIITSRTMPQYQPLLLLLPLPRMLFQLFFTLSEPIPHPCLLLLHQFSVKHSLTLCSNPVSIDKPVILGVGCLS